MGEMADVTLDEVLGWQCEHCGEFGGDHDDECPQMDDYDDEGYF